MTKIALVSCAKLQTNATCPAQDLYTSPVFRATRQYAERFADDWFVLSAEYGLVHHAQVIAPYNRILTSLTRVERQAWTDDIIRQSTAAIPKDAAIIVLAGEDYVKGLIASLTERGHSVQLPLGRLRIGQRIQWLKSQ